jgi:hypothetical protein
MGDEPSVTSPTGEPQVDDGVAEPEQEPAQPELTAEELETFTMKKRLNDEQYHARVRKVRMGCFPPPKLPTLLADGRVLGACTALAAFPPCAMV